MLYSWCPDVNRKYMFAQSRQTIRTRKLEADWLLSSHSKMIRTPSGLGSNARPSRRLFIHFGSHTGALTLRIRGKGSPGLIHGRSARYGFNLARQVQHEGPQGQSQQ